MMASVIEELVNQLSGALQKRDMNAGVERATSLANQIKQYQTQTRAQPFMSALQQAGERWGAATDDVGRQQANTQANTIRNAFLQSGGSPMDLPSNLWGGSPAQGFQTEAQKYSAPVTGTEGMTHRQLTQWLQNRLAEAGATGMYGGQPTFQMKQWQASPESQDWYLPLTKQSMEASLAATNRSNRGGGGGGGGGGGLTFSQSTQLMTSQAIADLISKQDPRQARALFQKNAAAMAAAGVNIPTVQKALSAQWPSYFGEGGGMEDFWYPSDEE